MADRLKSQRRFNEAHAGTKGRVIRLKPSHPAVRHGRPLFNRSYHPDERPRVLVSGFNSKKIGKVVTKGRMKGFPIYTLTLEERRTCPRTCHHWADCYGNHMHFAKRIQYGPDLEVALDIDLALLQRNHPRGFLVRLHVLGDFYSTRYVDRWRRWLKAFPALHVFGYTAWPETTSIGSAVRQIAADHRGRFAVRHSLAPGRTPEDDPFWAVSVSTDMDGAITCPAQTGGTDCCATCALCWSTDRPIRFLDH